MSQPLFKSAARQQESLLTPLEKRILVWFARGMPEWINSDHLTVLGFLGMIGAGFFYYLARWNPYFIANLVVIGACSLVNFFASDRLVFR